MYARVVRGQVSANKLDDLIQMWKDSVVSSARRQKGFISARLLVERDSGKLMTLGLWESKADFEATVAWNQEQIANFAAFFAETTLPVIEQYEVVAES